MCFRLTNERKTEAGRGATRFVAFPLFPVCPSKNERVYSIARAPTLFALVVFRLVNESPSQKFRMHEHAERHRQSTIRNLIAPKDVSVFFLRHFV